MFSTLSPTHKGMIFATLGYAGFFLSDICVKILSAHYSIYEIMCVAMLCATLVLLASFRWTGNGQRLTDMKHIKLHALRGVLNFIISLLFISALAALPMATTYAMIFAKPFFAVLLTMALYKETVPLRRWITIAVGFAGILIAMRPGSASFHIMMILPLAAAVFSATMFTVSKSMQGESPFKMGFYSVIIPAILCAPMAATDFIVPALHHLPFFMLSGIGVCIGIIFVSLAYSTAETAAVSPFHYTQMIWGLVFGFLIFGDVPDIFMLLGATVIIGSGLYLVWGERKR